MPRAKDAGGLARGFVVLGRWRARQGVMGDISVFHSRFSLIFSRQVGIEGNVFEKVRMMWIFPVYHKRDCYNRSHTTAGVQKIDLIILWNKHPIE